MINTSIFHDKTIDIYKYKKIFDTDECVTKKEYVKEFEGIKCNVQPIGIEKVKQDYGYNIDANFKIYVDYEDLDINNIKESDIVFWKNKTYRIEKIVPWNTYCIILIVEYKADIN